MPDIRDAFVQFTRSLQRGIAFGVGDFKFDDVRAGAGIFQSSVERDAQRSQADANPKIRMAAQRADQWQRDFAHCNGILACLDIDVGDTFWPVMDEELGELIVVSAEPGEVLVFAAHAAVSAIFPAKIGYLNDAAQKNAAPKFFGSGMGGAFV